MLSGLVLPYITALLEAAQRLAGTSKARRPGLVAVPSRAVAASRWVGRHASAILLVLTISAASTLHSRPTHLRAAYTSAAFLENLESRGEISAAGAFIPREEILWLARAIYSETKRPDEQELVAWVVRNRVETRYRGNGTYEETILDRYQFSAFNPNTPTRTFYTSLDWNSTSPGFQTALSIAWRVAIADEQERPFSTSTRHFYSARSMANGKVPHWAEDKRPVRLDRPVDAERFRFYERIA